MKTEEMFDKIEMGKQYALIAQTEPLRDVAYRVFADMLLDKGYAFISCFPVIKTPSQYNGAVVTFVYGDIDEEYVLKKLPDYTEGEITTVLGLPLKK